MALGSLDIDAEAAGVVRQAEAAFGGIDILVNNAGESQPFSTDWFTVSTDDWLRTYNSNVGGGVRLVKAFAPAIRDRSWGRIVFIGSSSYYLPIPDFPTYGPAKAALTNVMINLTKVLAGSDVTVNMVSPGSVLTETMRSNLLPLAHGAGWSDTDPLVIERRLIAEKWPNAVGRMGRPEEIAATVAFVASEEAAFMTEARIRVNGGEQASFHSDRLGRVTISLTFQRKDPAEVPAEL